VALTAYAVSLHTGQRTFVVENALSKDDHIVKWVKPTKPRSIDREAYNLLPDFLMVRETRVRVEQPGFRSRTLIIATTLLDAEEFRKQQTI
jgi:hypothetical protein